MRFTKYLLPAAFAALLFALPAPKAEAQISIGVGIGAAPVCPYGYYGYAPYNCAPYGYYGPEWFTNGVFLGAGPWHRGPVFYGHVNRSYDPRFGYHGAYPNRGDHWDHAHDGFHDFHGSHWSDNGGNYHEYRDHDRYMHDHH